MSVATIETGATRAAIMAWRDEATLSAMALVHEAATAAMLTLEARLDAVGAGEAMTNADATARVFLRPAMRNTVGPAVDQWFAAQARALRRVDARVEAIALRFAALGERPALPSDDAPPPVSWRAPAWLRDSFNAISETLDRGNDIAARAVPDMVRQRAEQVSARIGRKIGERSGAHERVRAAGRAELERMWLGLAAEADNRRPYLMQLLDMIDRATRNAGEMLA